MRKNLTCLFHAALAALAFAAAVAAGLWLEARRPPAGIKEVARNDGVTVYRFHDGQGRRYYVFRTACGLAARAE